MESAGHTWKVTCWHVKSRGLANFDWLRRRIVVSLYKDVQNVKCTKIWYMYLHLSYMNLHSLGHFQHGVLMWSRRFLHEYILVAIDYFTKWVEAASYASLTAAKVAKFIRSYIICRYAIPHELISDRGVHFRGEVDTLVQEYDIWHHRSSAYRPHTNGAVEAVNNFIKMILRKMVETSRDWSEKLPFALWAYHTSFRTSIGATLFSLVYSMEVVLPVEIEVGSLRVALDHQIAETDWL